ncbi:MAG: hypothetical protein U9N11_05155 [Campylobacterota bacterium]|nr:hypothetical protein [Campylobacterota bacterium]
MPYIDWLGKDDVVHHCYGIKFSEKIKKLLQEYFEIPLEALGFTEDWEMRLL